MTVRTPISYLVINHHSFGHSYTFCDTCCKGAPARESRTVTRLVSPASEPEKDFGQAPIWARFLPQRCNLSTVKCTSKGITVN